MNNKPLAHVSCIILLTAVTAGAITGWTITSGPGGGPVSCITIDGSDLYTSVPGGVFYASDTGECWYPASIDSEKIAYHQVHAAKGIAFSSTTTGLFRTMDNGKTWSKADSGLDDEYIRAVAVFDGFYFAGTDHGMYRSSDKGISWEGAGLTDTVVTALVAIDGMLFAATDTCGIFRSTKMDKQWEPSYSTFTNYRYLALCGGAILAGTDHSGIVRSTDTGATWTAPVSGLPDDMFNTVQALSAGKTGAFCIIDEILYRSVDEGATWSPCSSLHTPFDINVVGVSENAVVVGLHNGGVLPAGAKVAMFSPGQTAAGQHSFIFNTRYLAVGGYAVQVRIGASVYVKRISIVR